MRLVSAIAVFLLAAGSTAGWTAAEDVPLPRPRPASLAERFPNGSAPPASTGPISALAPAPELQELRSLPEPVSGPSACDLRLADLAQFEPLPTLIGPGECGGSNMVRLDAIMTRDQGRIALNPPATLRCGMAEAVAHFVRDDVAPAAAELGAPVTAIANFDSYDCRGRNRIVGAKLSEHGKGNAIDIRGIRLATGVVVELTSPIVSKELRERLRAAACGRFTTVLGPGSDGYHESHVHLDLAERSRGYRMCQWDVREPPVAVSVPLPPVRPVARSDDAIQQ